jgi:hypothetical protein
VPRLLGSPLQYALDSTCVRLQHSLGHSALSHTERSRQTFLLTLSLFVLVQLYLRMLDNLLLGPCVTCAVVCAVFVLGLANIERNVRLSFRGVLCHANFIFF